MIAEVRNQGRVLRVPLAKPRKSGAQRRKLARKRKLDAEQPKRVENHRMSVRARSQADKRLRALFRDVYEMLVSEERQKLGLDPFPTDRLVTHHVDPDTVEQCLDWAAVYAALDTAGVEHDAEGTHPPNASS
jgi:hypothetical protein